MKFRLGIAAALAASLLALPAGPASAASYGPDTQQQFSVFLPSSGANRPAVILIHGGAWTGGNRGAMNKYGVDLAARGIVAFNMEYRKSSAALWRDEPEDVQLMLDHVKNNAGAYGVNPSRIGLFGVSAGGHLALLGAMKGTGPSSAPHRVKAVASWAGPTNMPQILIDQGCPFTPCADTVATIASHAVQRFEGWCTLLGCYSPPGNLYQVPLNGCDGGTLSCVNRYRATSPAFQVDASDPPTFLGHALNDVVVPIEQTVEMAAVLRAFLVPVEVNTPLLLGHAYWETNTPAWQKTVAFFQQRL